MRKGVIVKTLAVFVAATCCIQAGDKLAWPRFRGPNGSGVAEGQKVPAEFGPEKNVKWKVASPGGWSSPIVAGANLVITAFEDGKLFTIAYHRGTGREAWRREAPVKGLEPFHKTEGSPAASTCATDGARVVSYFGSGGLFCYDLDGKEIWKLPLPTVMTAGEFGSGVSPIIAEGTVILVRDEANGSKIMAVDLESGKLKWEAPRLSRTSYATPVIWETETGKEVVAPGHARMTAYDVASGKERWFVSGTPSTCASSPVIEGELLLLAGGTVGGDDQEFQVPPFDGLLKDMDANGDGVLTAEEGKKMFGEFFANQDTDKDGKLTRQEWDATMKFFAEGKNTAIAVTKGGRGDISETHVAWRSTKGLPYIATAIAYQGRYIMVKDGGVVTAYDSRTGKQMYHERLAAPGSYYASPVAADGRIYFFSLAGVATVISAEETPAVILRDIKLGGRIGATPAIAEDTLYVRTDKELWAFGAKQ